MLSQELEKNIRTSSQKLKRKNKEGMSSQELQSEIYNIEPETRVTNQIRENRPFQ